MGKSLVLIIEDQPTLGVLYEDALRLVGYDVKIMRDGLAAINYIEMGNVPTFIILDINLPRMSGRDVLQHIRKQPEYASVPVLVITANTVMAERVKKELTEYDRLLMKPVHMRDLQAFAKQIRTRQPDHIADTQETPQIDDDMLTQPEDKPGD
jgi:two-component system chemotaxis response regulator CheY